MRLLVVTATAAEAQALDLAGRAEVVVGGIGPVAAAVATTAAIAAGRYDLVISAGIAGGFGPLVPGDVAVASTIAFADLGIETTSGGVSPLATAASRWDVEAALAVSLAERTGGHLGTILTVVTVTGTQARADRLLDACPDAVAEAMEGAGVAAAATACGLPFAEVRGISNAVGPRERDAWRIDDALAALGRAMTEVVTGWPR